MARNAASKKKNTKKNKNKKKYNRKKNFIMSKSGYLRVVRWSNQDAANNCALQVNGGDVVSDGVGTATFTLNQMAGSQELVNLFDNYRITKVLYRWVITRNPSEINNTTFRGIYPRLVWRHDFNDANAISRAQMYQSANIKEVFFTDNFQRTKWYTLNPSVLAQLFEAGVQVAYAPKWKQWMDTNDSGTTHYGLKFVYSELYNGMSLRLEAKLVAEFKGIS